MSGNVHNQSADQESGGVSPVPADAESAPESQHKGDAKKKEIGGRAGPDPTRYGDWEKNGRCIDF